MKRMILILSGILLLNINLFADPFENLDDGKTVEEPKKEVIEPDTAQTDYRTFFGIGGGYHSDREEPSFTLEGFTMSNREGRIDLIYGLGFTGIMSKDVEKKFNEYSLSNRSLYTKEYINDIEFGGYLRLGVGISGVYLSAMAGITYLEQEITTYDSYYDVIEEDSNYRLYGLAGAGVTFRPLNGDVSIGVDIDTRRGVSAIIGFSPSINDDKEDELKRNDIKGESPVEYENNDDDESDNLRDFFDHNEDDRTW